MKTSTATRLAIAFAAALLIASAVCWGPGSRPGPAPTATEAAVSVPTEGPTPAPAGSPAPGPTLSPTAGPTAAPATTAIASADRSVPLAATSTPFTLSDLAATSTSVSTLLPPALPSVTVPPTPTPTPPPTSPPPPAATASADATPTASASPSPTATPGSSAALAPPTLPYGPQVLVDRTVFTVDIAFTPEEKRVGLSGREGLDRMSGMLFLYETGRPYEFWMKDMLFAIDIVWIAPDCTVGDITHGLQPPGAGAADSEVARATPSVEAAHVLEIAAGTSQRLGMEVGDSVRFVDIPGPAGDSC